MNCKNLKKKTIHVFASFSNFFVYHFLQYKSSITTTGLSTEEKCLFFHLKKTYYLCGLENPRGKTMLSINKSLTSIYKVTTLKILTTHQFT